ncbi:MAG: hypothetical protein ACKOPG_02740 [Novosphingobium sp.]
MDQARHARARAKCCSTIALVAPMAPWRKDLIDAVLRNDRIVKVMIGMNLIVSESASRTVTRVLQRIPASAFCRRR